MPLLFPENINGLQLYLVLQREGKGYMFNHCSEPQVIINFFQTCALNTMRPTCRKFADSMIRGMNHTVVSQRTSSRVHQAFILAMQSIRNELDGSYTLPPDQADLHQLFLHSAWALRDSSNNERRAIDLIMSSIELHGLPADLTPYDFQYSCMKQNIKPEREIARRFD